MALKYVRLRGGGGETGIPRAVFREMEALKQVKRICVSTSQLFSLEILFPVEESLCCGVERRLPLGN